MRATPALAAMLFGCALLLSACGIKGPLYMPPTNGHETAHNADPEEKAGDKNASPDEPTPTSPENHE